jgi:hypothetical protein
MYREPQLAASEGWRYAAVAILRPPATVTPLGAPGAVITIADLLP